MQCPLHLQKLPQLTGPLWVVDACDQQRQAMEAAVKVLAVTLNTGR
jgi:hypothetical protein